ncbi:MAG: PspC domain-containing protein [Acidimicrobiia bacterium]|jgi:phage shock protein PspC (stress-responsive transcriptional regulator)
MEPAPPTSPITPPPPPPFGVPHARELRRRPSEGHLGGVCAGLAEYFAVDPVIVRIAAVILAFSGPGIPAYLLAWIFVPEADEAAPPGPSAGQGRADRGAQAFGIVLLAVAASILLGGWWSPARRWLFPVGLIALGVWLVLRRTDRPDGPGSPSAAAPGPGEAPATADGRPRSSDETEAGGAPGGAVAAAVDQVPGVGAPTAGPWGDDTPPPPPAPLWDEGRGRGPGPHRLPLGEEELAARRRRKMVFPGVLGALLVWTGIAFLAGTTVQTGLAVALCIVGVGFVLGAFVGGSKVLVVPAVLLTAALIMSSVLDLPMSGPVGERTWVPETTDQLQHYEVSVGEGTLDLTELEVPEGGAVDVRASVGVGHLLVIVPDDVALSIHGEASLGDVTIFGRSDSGWGPSSSRSFGADRSDELIGLELEVGIGQVEVVSAREGGGSATSTGLR